MKFEDFSLKAPTGSAADKSKKEQLLLEQLKRGELAVETINGELKLQFEEAIDFPSIPGKPVPYIALVISNYTQSEGRME